MKNTLLATFCCFLFLSCASVEVTHQGNLSGETQHSKASYGWFKDAPSSEDVRINNPTIEKLVREAVDQQLQAMGYKKTEPDQADYLIAWFGNITEEVKEISMSRFYGRYGYATLLGDPAKKEKTEDGKVLKTFARGTLILDVLDRDSKKVLWRGSATDTLGQKKMSTNEKRRYIEKSVAKILEELPRK